MKLPCSLLLQNIGALTLLQFANYVAPLLTLPYLTRVLGLTAFGQVAFVQVLMAWFVILVNYGFPWSATRDIAARRHDHAYVSERFSANWAAQWLLAGLGGAVLVILVVGVPAFRRDAALYLAGYSIVLGHVLFPVWLLQGLERLREVALIQIFGRLTLLLSVFLLVNGPEDTILAVATRGAGGMVAGLLSLWWIKRNGIAAFKVPSLRQLLDALREGGVIFLSQFAISLYTIFVPTALGLVSGPMAVGHYALADRMRGAAQALMGPLSQALFPRMSYLFGVADVGNARRLLTYSFWATVLVAGGGSLAIWLFADWIVLILGGPEFAGAAEPLRWIAPVSLLVGLSNLFGVQIMLPRQRVRAFNAILISAAVLGLALVFPMAMWMDATGAAITLLIVEAWVTLAMAVYIASHGLVKMRAAAA